MATGTTWMLPDFWMTGRVKSSAVAPQPMAALGWRRISTGMMRMAISSRPRSLMKAAGPQHWPSLSATRMPESDTSQNWSSSRGHGQGHAEQLGRPAGCRASC